MSKSTSYINSINDDTNNNDELPSYEDVLREEQEQAQGRISSYDSSHNGDSNNYLNVPPPPNRPPQKPPRPYSSSNTSSAASSTSHLRPQQRPPNSVKPPNNNNGRPPLPWVYPKNFYCPKCNNTGYKLKNGKSCRSCWRTFCPKNPINYNMGPTSSSFYVSPAIGMPPQASPYIPPTNNYGYGYGYGYGYPPMPMSPIPPPQQQQQQRPLVVKPGDPRLGGVLCGECRGTGRVSFLLDEDLCPLCNGLGRIITRR